MPVRQPDLVHTLFFQACELGKRAGINKDVYPHLIRHTMATNMLNNGASLAEVQKYLGHTSPASTQIYAQLDNEVMQQSHKKHVI